MVIRSQSDHNKPCLFLLKGCDCIAHKAHLSSDFQCDNLKFSKLHDEPTLHSHIKLEYRVICLDTCLDTYEISKDLVDGKCLKKLCKNSEYFKDLTELTKKVKNSIKSS